MTYIVPPSSLPIPTPLSVYGNNATVACPCGRVVVVRSLGHPGQGAWQCGDCQRWYKGYPEDGDSITHVLVWDVGAAPPPASPTRRIEIEARRQP